LEFIYERSFYPELAYIFKHALTHDVAYNSLLLQRRKELHRLVARAIEELYAERLPESHEMLAYHYERGEVWEKALEYLVKAGQKAPQAYANQEALESTIARSSGRRTRPWEPCTSRRLTWGVPKQPIRALWI